MLRSVDMCHWCCHSYSSDLVWTQSFMSIKRCLFIPLSGSVGQPAKWWFWLSPRREQRDLTFGWAEIFKEAIQSLFPSVSTQWVIPIRDQLQLLLSQGWKACSKKTMDQDMQCLHTKMLNVHTQYINKALHYDHLPTMTLLLQSEHLWPIKD